MILKNANKWKRLGKRIYRWFDDDVEHETVKLGLWKRISALEFNRILSREHKKGLLKLVGFALRADLMLLHRLEQG